jgi:hypothetical protein
MSLRLITWNLVSTILKAQLPPLYAVVRKPHLEQWLVREMTALQWLRVFVVLIQRQPRPIFLRQETLQRRLTMAARPDIALLAQAYKLSLHEAVLQPTTTQDQPVLQLRT